jgi:CheY-like chemotaxis protein
MKNVPWILVVDDEPGIRDVIAALLEEEGYLVHCAESGADALAAVERGEFDLVLSDVRMPDIDGPTLIRRLRRRGHQMPALLMSAVYADVDIPDVPFVPKPFDADRLLGSVASALVSVGSML